MIILKLIVLSPLMFILPRLQQTLLWEVGIKNMYILWATLITILVLCDEYYVNDQLWGSLVSVFVLWYLVVSAIYLYEMNND